MVNKLSLQKSGTGSITMTEADNAKRLDSHITTDNRLWPVELPSTNVCFKRKYFILLSVELSVVRF